MRIQLAGPALALLMPVLLAACGGGGSSGSTSQNELQPSATSAADGRSRQVNATCSFSQTLGAARTDSLRIEHVSWLQAVEQNAAAGNARLMAGKPVLARVDLLASGSPVTPDNAYLLVSHAGSCTRINLTGPSTVPASIDPQTLSTAYSASIPAALIQPGAEVSIVFDTAAGRSASEADKIYRVYALPVSSAVSETVRVIPITYKGQNGFVTSNADLAGLMARLHPVTSFGLNTEAAFAPASLSQSVLGFLGSGEESFVTMQAVLSELDDECARRNGKQASARTAPKCLGVFPNNLTFRSASLNASIVGLAYVGGTTMLTQSVSTTDALSVVSPYSRSHWLDFRAVTVAHEYGHLLNLNHAACGGPTDTDARLYPDGRLGGGAGYDTARSFYFSSQRLGSDGQPQFGDLMSYCAKEWASDRGYLAELAYRGAGSARVAAQESRAAPRSHWLKISHQQGQWQLRPVDFTPATLRITDMLLQAQTALATMPLPVYSAVLADAPEATLGPYFVDIGELNVQQLSLPTVKTGEVLAAAVWSAGEWLGR